MNTLTKRDRVTGLVLNFQPPTANVGLSVADSDAERAVISAVLQEPSLFVTVAAMLEPRDFYGLMHGFYWYAFSKLMEAQQPIDILSVSAVLTNEPTAPQKGDAAIDELSQLYSAAPRAANVEYYAQRVRDAALRLRLLKAADDMKAAALDKSVSVVALTDTCNELLFKATEQRVGGDDTSAAVAVGEYWQLLNERMASNTLPGLKTGWEKWDDPRVALGGLYAGDVTVVAGKEGYGKSTWMLSLLRNLLSAGKRVALFTLEMQKKEIMQVLFSMETAIWKSQLRDGHLTPEQYEAFKAAAMRIADWKLHIVDEFRAASNPLTPLALRRKLRLLLREGVVDLVAIDGLWLMEATDERDRGQANRPRAVAQITYELSDIAKGDLGQPFPVLLMHQYSGDVAQKKVKKPTLYHLAESAGVRRNAQVIVGLWRDLDSDWFEAHVLKDRATGHANYIGYFKYNAARSLYEEGGE